MMSSRGYQQLVHEHVERFFDGHAIRRRDFELGPVQRDVPGFHAIEVGPGPRLELTTYVTVGAGFREINEHRLEFVTVAPAPLERHVEILAMTVHYHCTGEPLGVDHTLPIGEPWLPGSTQDHLLVSLPYPFGPQLETLAIPGSAVQLLWLLPISASERAYKKANGVEALESLFDDVGLEYWNPTRKPVV